MHQSDLAGVLGWCIGLVYWAGILGWCIGVVYWPSVLVWCIGVVYWGSVLGWCIRMVYWGGVLGWSIGVVYWAGLLGWSIGMVYWVGVIFGAKALFSSVYCILLVQPASANVFYSTWWLEDITFLKSFSLHWNFFNRHVAVYFEASVLKEVRILCGICTITVRC